MSFESIGDFLAMGHHGAYVWSAYGLTLLVLTGNIVWPIMARKHYLQVEARRLRREERA
ncbi:heme exporter protein D [Pseudomonas duriflava]|uniref:Heme exporter protein D n=1 Tax=Pseudomonas duriflava TaxID=459528 RepID=A0A562QAW5_9PSED|nr:heme exporter protein CcmD [Pseudomonas duriflava]TWI53888.1 heme exporter protein D [Pseudomonas duriflava]